MKAFANTSEKSSAPHNTYIQPWEKVKVKKSSVPQWYFQNLTAFHLQATGWHRVSPGVPRWHPVSGRHELTCTSGHAPPPLGLAGGGGGGPMGGRGPRCGWRGERGAWWIFLSHVQMFATQNSPLQPTLFSAGMNFETVRALFPHISTCY